jgi:hypothetical protein
MQNQSLQLWEMRMKTCHTTFIEPKSVQGVTYGRNPHGTRESQLPKLSYSVQRRLPHVIVRAHEMKVLQRLSLFQQPPERLSRRESLHAAEPARSLTSEEVGGLMFR